MFIPVNFLWVLGNPSSKKTLNLFHHRTNPWNIYILKLISCNHSDSGEQTPTPPLLSFFSFSFFYPFVSFAPQWCQLRWLIEDQVFLFHGCGRPTLTCWWQPEILLTPARSQHSLCRALSRALICLLRRREREKSRAGRSGMLFCAFCCSHSLLQSGGSLASIITTVSLSLFLSHSHQHPLVLLLRHLLPASNTLLVYLSLPPLPSCIPPSLLLARHNQNIDILNVLRQLAGEINHSCKS